MPDAAALEALAERVARLEAAFRDMCTAEQIMARAGYPEQAPPARSRHLHLVHDTNDSAAGGERCSPQRQDPPAAVPRNVHLHAINGGKS